MAMKYLLVSVKHSPKRDPYITFWRPGNSGYTWPLKSAGQYDEEDVRRNPGYYNNFCDTFPVPVSLAYELAIPKPKPGLIDGDAGPVVQNTIENWKRLKEGRFQP